MCDPFNTSTEAALWHERNDLDPFMAEHYAANAQHELDRALAACPHDQQRIVNVRRLLGSYHALASLAQLPDESDFEDEIVGSEDVGSVHRDRLALMRSGGHETRYSSSSALSRSFDEAGANDNVMDASGNDTSRSRKSSVESIVRDDGLDAGVRDQQHHVKRKHAKQAQDSQLQMQQPEDLQQHLPQQQTFRQQVPQQQTSQQWASPPVYYPPQQMIQYYQPPPQPMMYYQPPPQLMPMYHQSNYAALAMSFMQNAMQQPQPSNINFFFGPTYIYSGSPSQQVPNTLQPEQYGQDPGLYDRGYDEIIRGENARNDGSRARRRRRARKGKREGR